MVFAFNSVEINAPSAQLKDVIFRTPGNITVTGKLAVSGSVRIERANTFKGGPIEVKGDIASTVIKPFSAPMLEMTLVGGIDQKIMAEVDAAFFPGIRIEKPKGKVILKGAFRVSGDWIVKSGIVEAKESSITLGPGNITLDAGDMIFHDLAFDTQGNITVAGKVRVHNDLTITHVNVMNEGEILVGNRIRNLSPTGKITTAIRAWKKSEGFSP